MEWTKYSVNSNLDTSSFPLKLNNKRKQLTSYIEISYSENKKRYIHEFLEFLIESIDMPFDKFPKLVHILFDTVYERQSNILLT